MRDESSSDESDDEEEFRDGSDEDTLRLIAKAKEKTLKALEDDELPNAVLMSLPFMVIFVFCFLITILVYLILCFFLSYLLFFGLGPCYKKEKRGS